MIEKTYSNYFTLDSDPIVGSADTMKEDMNKQVQDWKRRWSKVTKRKNKSVDKRKEWDAKNRERRNEQARERAKLKKLKNTQP